MLRGMHGVWWDVGLGKCPACLALGGGEHMCQYAGLGRGWAQHRYPAPSSIVLLTDTAKHCMLMCATPHATRCACY